MSSGTTYTPGLFFSAFAHCLGVHVTSTAVRAVELIRIGKWVVVRRCWTYPVQSDPARALAELRSEVGPTARVVTHVSPSDVHITIKEAFTDDLERADAAWTLGRSALPLGAEPQDYATTLRLLSVSENRARIGIGVVDRAFLDATVTVFEEAGLVPTALVVTDFEIPAAFAFDSAMTAGAWRVELGAEQHTLHLDQAMLHAVSPTAEASGATDTLYNTAFEPILPAPASNEEQKADSSGVLVRASADAATSSPARPLRGLRGAHRLNAKHTQAAALAARGVFALPDPKTNGCLLDPTESGTQAARADLHGARRATLGMVGTALGLLLLLLAAEWSLSQRVSIAEEDTLPYAGIRDAIEREEESLRRHQMAMAHAERDSESRTQVALLLGLVTSITPTDIQWSEVVLQVDGTDDPLFVLRGRAAADSSLAIFLQSLEVSSATGSVRLVESASGRPDPETPSVTPLRSFELQASVPGIAGLRPASAP